MINFSSGKGIKPKSPPFPEGTTMWEGGRGPPVGGPRGMTR